MYIQFASLIISSTQFGAGSAQMGLCNRSQPMETVSRDKLLIPPPFPTQETTGSPALPHPQAECKMHSCLSAAERLAWAQGTSALVHAVSGEH